MGRKTPPGGPTAGGEARRCSPITMDVRRRPHRQYGLQRCHRSGCWDTVEMSSATTGPHPAIGAAASANRHREYVHTTLWFASQ